MGFDLQSVEKYGCKIITVEPAQRRVEGVIKSGAVVQIAVYTVDPFFRWPKVGENWMIRRENGTWYLDSKWQNQEGEAESNTTIINNLNEGDALIDAPTEKVYLTSGNLLATQPYVTSSISTAVAAAVTPPLVSALPASPVDGQTILFQTPTLAGAGIVWEFRYHAASSSTHKWEFIGGSDWFEGAAAVESEGSGTAFAATVLPPIAFTLPLSGDYDVWATGTPVNATASTSDVRLSIGNTAITKTTEITLGWSQASFGFYTPMSNTGRIGNLVAGEELHMLQAYSLSKQKATWYGKTLRVRPVRVG